jgi:hypothetical protein
MNTNPSLEGYYSIVVLLVELNRLLTNVLSVRGFLGATAGASKGLLKEQCFALSGYPHLGRLTKGAYRFRPP